MGFSKEGIPIAPTYMTSAFVCWELVLVLTLEIRNRSSRPINQERLDSLAKWPSAKGEKNMLDHFFKRTKTDITHVVRADFLTSRDLCRTELEEGELVLPTRNWGTITFEGGAGSARAPFLTQIPGNGTLAAVCERVDSSPWLHRLMPNFILKTLPGNKAFIQKPVGCSW